MVSRSRVELALPLTITTYNSKPRRLARTENNLSLPTWNVRTFLRDGTTGVDADRLKKSQVDNAAVYETRMPGAGMKEIGGYTLYNS